MSNSTNIISFDDYKTRRDEQNERDQEHDRQLKEDLTNLDTWINMSDEAREDFENYAKKSGMMDSPSSSEEDKRYLYRRNCIWHFKKRLKGTKKIHRCSLHTDDLVVALQKRDALLQKWNEIDRKN